MRVALVASPAPLGDLKQAPGFLDGDMIRARLSLEDAGFRLVDLDPKEDLAVQIEEAFDSGAIPSGAAVFFYASCRVLLGEEDELFLTLDASQPDTGDSLRDISALFRERTSGPVAFFLECRHAPDPDDPFRSAAVVAAAKADFNAAKGALELLVAANPVADGDEEDRSSALTRALIEAMDGPGAERGLTLARFFVDARDSVEVATSVRCFAHVKGTLPFEILPVAPEGARDSEPNAPPSPPAEALEDDDADDSSLNEATLPILDRAPIFNDAGLEDATLPPITREPATLPLSALPRPAPEPDDDDQRTTQERQAAPETAPFDPRRRASSIEIVFEAVTPTPGSVAPGSSPRPELGDAGSARSGAGSSEEQAPVTRPSGLPAPPPPPPVPNRPAEPVRDKHDDASEAAPRPSDHAPLEAPRGKPAAPKAIAASDHVALGNALRDAGDLEAALASYKRALGMLAPAALAERADIYVRLGELKLREDKRREALASFEKAIALFPPPSDGAPLPAPMRAALEARLALNLKEGDLRAVAISEDAIVNAVPEAERFDLLVGFGKRWQDETRVLGRARAAFEKARALRPDVPEVLERLVSLYEGAGMVGEAVTAARRLAEATPEPRARAERYFALGKRCLTELKREELGLEMLELALSSDPTMLEPLAIVARVLADRGEWKALESAYRRMLDRIDGVPAGQVRRDVTFELCLRLGLLARDHLGDADLALDAFEDALTEKPGDLSTRLLAAEVGREHGAEDRAVHHLARAAAIEPRRAETYHDLFELCERQGFVDQAFQVASVAVHVGLANERERFVFDEQHLEGVPSPSYVLAAEGWAWLRPIDHEPHAEAVLAAVAPAAIGARLALLEREGRLPTLDPSLKQDLEKSTISVVRSFGWASHFLNVPAPAVYLNDDKDLALASVIAEEPTVMVGVKAQRGRTPTEIVFLVGRHLAYHVGSHRLLLYYPSMEDLTACFLAAVRTVRPDTPAPASLRPMVSELQKSFARRLTDAQRADLDAAVQAFEAAGSRVHLVEWAGDVERCATRAGLLLSGDLGAAVKVLSNEPRQVLGADEKIGDLLAFAVSEEHHALRASLGIALEEP